MAVSVLLAGCSEGADDGHRDAQTADATAQRFDAGRCEAPAVESAAPATARHVQTPVYPDAAPMGGDHSGCWANYGVYDEALPPGRWVHNLEHGAIVLLHACQDGCVDERQRLEAFGAQHARTIVTPAPGLATRFAIVAWGHRILTDCLDLDAFGAFYEAHFNRAPEDVSEGAPPGC